MGGTRTSRMEVLDSLPQPNGVAGKGEVRVLFPLALDARRLSRFELKTRNDDRVDG